MAQPAIPLSSLPHDHDLPERFLALAVAWQQATAHLSSRADKFAHPTYQQILALGAPAVPEILRWLERGGRGHWDHALAELTGERPELLDTARTLSEVQRVWLEWGKKKGHLAR